MKEVITNLDDYNKPKITVPTKQYKELKKSKEKLERELEEKSRKTRSLLERTMILENKNKSLEHQVETLEGRLKEIFVREFLEIQKEWKEIEACRPYEEFFDRSAQALQTLLGLPGAMDVLAEEKIDYYLWEVAAWQLIGDARHFGGIIRDGKLLLPEPEETLEEKEIEGSMEEETLEEIERYLYEDKRKVKVGRIALQKKGTVQQLGAVIQELENYKQEKKPVCDFIWKISKRIEGILEENQIYPMFSGDQRLTDSPALQKDFIPVNEYSIKYPGLFIQRDGRYEVLGTNIGMDDGLSGR